MARPSATDADPGSYARARCGCEIWTQDDGSTMIVRPCTEDCPLGRWMMRRAGVSGKPVQFLF